MLDCFQRTENRRICFGKSQIHGWGLFARRNIQEGEMVHSTIVNECSVFKNVDYRIMFLPRKCV